MDLWEREQRELAERDTVEDEANRIRKDKELRVRRERREKRRAEVLEMMATNGQARVDSIELERTESEASGFRRYIKA